MTNEELIEKLADLEHERWSSWMRWMFDNWTDENVDRWKYQMIMPYSELPEHSKEADRKEARKTMEIIEPEFVRLRGLLAKWVNLHAGLEDEIEVLKHGCGLDGCLFRSEDTV